MAKFTIRIKIVYLLVVLLLAAVPVFATEIPIDEQIVNGGFDTNLTGWTTVGTANVRPSTDLINTSGGNVGFNSFFTSSFAVLGDVSGAIGGDPDSGSSSISQSFTLPATLGGFTVYSYDLDITFSSVFDGDDSRNTGNAKDTFSTLLSVLLNNETLYSQNSDPLPDGAPSATNSQQVNNPYIEEITGLLPGTYTLTFLLDETALNGANVTNTAAGIDNVSVTGEAYAGFIEEPPVQPPVQPSPVPEPGTLLLLGSGLIGLGLFGRTRKR